MRSEGHAEHPLRNLASDSRVHEYDSSTAYVHMGHVAIIAYVVFPWRGSWARPWLAQPRLFVDACSPLRKWRLNYVAFTTHHPRLFLFLFRWKMLWKRSCRSLGSLAAKPRRLLQVLYASAIKQVASENDCCWRVSCCFCAFMFAWRSVQCMAPISLALGVHGVVRGVDTNDSMVAVSNRSVTPARSRLSGCRHPPSSRCRPSKVTLPGAEHSIA